MTAYGIGSAGSILGAITGGVALSKTNQLREDCGDSTSCPPEMESDADEARVYATVSTVGFVIAGVGAAAGTVLLLVRPGGSSDEQARAPSIAPVLGVGHFGLRGTF